MKTNRRRRPFRRRKTECGVDRAGRRGAFSSGPLQPKERVAIWGAPRVRGCSSDGRALQSHCRGQGFDSPRLHQFFGQLFPDRIRFDVKKAYQPILWILFGAAYGLLGRILFGYNSQVFDIKIISISFIVATPFTIGAIVVYGLRNTGPSISQMILAPWLAIALTLAGSAISLLEGTVCIVLASPIFFGASSIGGLIMGLTLRWTKKGTSTLNSFLVLPLALASIEPTTAQQPQILEDRVSIEVDAPPHRIWEEIKNARNIRREELPWNFTHWIGVPRPLEGFNVMSPEGEVRYSKWERGVHFSALVTHQIEDRTITWKYKFGPDSFPKGSLDDHVKIGGQYFNLYDTTFNLEPLSANTTRLEIISHYSVTTNVNFYGVPVARFIANDFMSTIIHLYKYRSEKQHRTDLPT